MKVGVVTWFSYENYGTKLQAIALQEYLKKIGAEPILINFTPPEEVQNIKKKTWKEKIKELASIKDVLKKFHNKCYQYAEIIGRKKYEKELIERRIKLKEIISGMCVLSEKIDSVEKYINTCNQMDCLIFGSDQIWNPNWFHPFYYADFNEIGTKKVAYAASLGVSEIREEIKNSYRKSLVSFHSIGIREKTGQQIIQEVCIQNVEQVLDPTLLHTKDEWDILLRIKQDEADCGEDYICVYFLGENLNHWKTVYSIAKKENLKVKIIPNIGSSYLRKGQVLANASVQDFVTTIKNARYIFTDSFHATVFSVLYNCNFYTFERFASGNELSQNSRIFDFLSSLNLGKRILRYNTFEIYETNKIDYEVVNEKLETLINRSKFFLNKSIWE